MTKELQAIDIAFEEWAFKWLNSKRLLALPVWQKNILDLSARGERPDAYLSAEMSAFNKAINSLPLVDFGAFVYSALSRTGKKHPPAKTIAYQLGISRETLIKHIPKSRKLLTARFNSEIDYLIKIQEDFGVRIILD